MTKSGWQINQDDLLRRIQSTLEGDGDRDRKLAQICRLLADEIKYYDWVGFYFVDPKHERELYLGPYVGEPTEHNHIPFGKGICGQAAATGKSFLVDDVTAEGNYLACSLKVKAEIVVPMFKNKIMIGQIDIDSHTAGVFDDTDRRFLEQVCAEVSRLF